MDAAGALLNAVEGLYAATIEPARWSSTIESIADLMACDHALLICSAASGEPVIYAHARVDPYLAARLASPEALGLMARFRRSVPRNIVFRGEEVRTANVAAQREYHEEFVRPMNGGHALAAQLQWSDALMTDIAFCRRRGEERAGEAEIAMLHAVLPHLANAVEIQFRLRSLEQCASSALQMLDRIEAGVILTDETGQPTFLNRRAVKILDEADGLRLACHRLTASLREEDWELRRAIASVGARADVPLLRPNEPTRSRPPRRLRVSRPSLRPPLALTLLPIWRTGMEVPGAPAPRVAIWIAEPDVRAPLDERLIGEVLSLTARETQVATLLASGFDLKSAAAILGIKQITARNHLKHAFEKTHVHSQAALVALVRGLADPLS